MAWFNNQTTTINAPAELEQTRVRRLSRFDKLKAIIANNFKSAPVLKNADGSMATMDYSGQIGFGGGLNFSQSIPDSLMSWYGNQSFIGFQACMLMSQHWLISAACEIPVVDALRKGHEVVRNDGEKIDVKVLSQLNKANKDIKLTEKLTNFGKFARVFGYRIAIFKVESNDPLYYENPFNPDGVTKNSYKGIALPDPYYVSPQLSTNGFDPADPDFYEPEYWLIQGKKYHKSHLIIFRHCTVPMLMRPTYLYGGISLIQQIYEKVYSAEQAANEANRLLMTKRLMVRQGDISSALMDQVAFEEKMLWAQQVRDNFGEQIIDTGEDIRQLETALSEVTNVIAQKYEHVAAVARMPANKLMQSQLQGFGSIGDAEEAIYNGMLETMQEQCFTEFLERHYLISIRSLGIAPFEFEIKWPAIDTLTELEQAQINQIKAATDQVNLQSGAITGEDINSRLATDPDSGYDGIKYEAPEVDYSGDNEEADNKQATQDAIPDGAHWITLEDGQHVLIGGEGKVIAGAGGNMNGKYYGVHISAAKKERPHVARPRLEKDRHAIADKMSAGIDRDKMPNFGGINNTYQEFNMGVTMLRAGAGYYKDDGAYSALHNSLLETKEKILKHQEGTVSSEWEKSLKDIEAIGNKPAETVKNELSDDKNTYTTERFDGKDNVKETFSRGEYVTHNLGGKDRFGEIDGISNKRQEVSVEGVWLSMGSVYKTDKPEEIKVKKTATSNVIKSVNKANGADLGESDRINNKPTQDSEFDESKHPRGEDGRFGQANADDFVLAPDGSVDFGFIPELDSKIESEKIHPSAPIRMEEGGEFGRAHIQPERLKAFKENGYASESEMLDDVAKHYTHIYEQPNGRLLLVKRNGRAKFSVVELQKQGEYYGVTTLFLEDASQKGKPYETRSGRKLLWPLAEAAPTG
jgi:uncharacterized protein